MTIKPSLTMIHSDEAYPFKESISYENPMDPKERKQREIWTKQALDLAGISDALVMEKTYRIDLAFRSYCDYVHFCIADDIPAPGLSKIEETDLTPVCMDFVSILPVMKANRIAMNEASSVIKAFRAATRRSATEGMIDFETEAQDQVVIVNAKNPYTYLRFWRSIPAPLKKTLYIAETPAPT